MKYEWKKSEKDIYLPPAEPQELSVQAYTYITIAGTGDPSGEEFGKKVAALYSVAYAVRMMPKNGFTPAGYFEYTVYPLEGVWSGDALDRNSYEYTLMIRQPGFVDDEIFAKALEIARKKKPSPLLESVELQTLEDGHAVQMMHIGPYASEADSFAKMQQYLQAHGLQRRGDSHREIYLTDPSKGDPSKQKTVLRYRAQ